MPLFKWILAPLMLATTLAAAQAPPAERRPPPIDVGALLGIDATRAAQVDAILASAHEKMREARRQIGRPADDATRSMLHAAMQAIRAQTDTQLGAVLSADELQKLHEAMRTSRRPRRGGPSPVS